MDKTVRLWDVRTGEETQKLKGHYNDVRAVAFSPDGKTVVSGSSDRTVRLWDIATGEKKKLEGHDSEVRAVAISPDGKKIVSGSGDRTVRLWNVSTGEEVRRFRTTRTVTQLVFDEQGTSLSTNEGSLSLRPYLGSSQSSNVLRPLSVELHQNWIRREGRDTLWLPYEYRGGRSSSHLDTLVIGQLSGAMSFFRIKNG